MTRCRGRTPTIPPAPARAPEPALPELRAGTGRHPDRGRGRLFRRARACRKCSPRSSAWRGARRVAAGRVAGRRPGACRGDDRHLGRGRRTASARSDRTGGGIRPDDPRAVPRRRAGAGGLVSHAQRFRRWYCRGAGRAVPRRSTSILAPATPYPGLSDRPGVDRNRRARSCRPPGISASITQPLSFAGLPVVAAPVAGRRRRCRLACRSSRRRGARTSCCGSPPPPKRSACCRAPRLSSHRMLA